MGGATSSNASEAITNVTTNILQDTEANVFQVSENKSEVNLNRCNIIGSEDVLINSVATQEVENNQITSSNQDANVTNDISQSVMQEASSTVGSMGVGFANASNSASLLVNSSTTIRNAIRSESSQAANNMAAINCNNSTIVGRNIEISTLAKNNLLATQVTTGEQVASVINKVSQSITQKASATVEGWSSGLIALAILIAAIGYALAKPLSSGAVKIVIVFVIILVLIGLMAFMYVRKTPPFFNDLQDCSPVSTLGGCGIDECGDLKVSTQNLDNAPLKYLYGLIEGDQNTPRTFLFDMVINGGIGNERENGGYNVARQKNLKTELDLLWDTLRGKGLVTDADKPPYILLATNYNIPDAYLKYRRGARSPLDGENKPGVGSICTPSILKEHNTKANETAKEFELRLAKALDGGEDATRYVCPTELNLDQQTSDAKNTQDYGRLATSNVKKWKEWLKGSDRNKRAKLGRFILYYLARGSDNIFYMDDDELVSYTDTDGKFIISRGKDTDKAYKFIPRATSSRPDWRRGLTTGGTITGIFGVCKNRTYKLQHFMRRVGIWIGLVGILICILFILKPLFMNRRKTTQTQ